MKQLRSFTIIASMIIGFLLLIIIITGIVLGRTGPLHPGNLFFPYQYFAEQEFKILYPQSDRLSAYLLDLMDRRIDDLSIRSGTKYELQAMEYLNKILDQVANSIALKQQENRSVEIERFYASISRINEIINQLRIVPVNDKDVYQKFQARILAYMQMANMSGSVIADTNSTAFVNTVSVANQPIPTPVFFESSGLIPFPPGSVGAMHAFYPLIGQHALLKCETCHDQGKYKDTGKTCIFCHIAKRPVPHYSGACELCHTPVSWKDIHFDHIATNAEDCRSCHYVDRPDDHYFGQCSACHVIQAWDIVNFNHAVAGAVDCISCHAEVAPVNHYGGQCSRCHNTSDWKSVTFDHTGFTDCVSCHADKEPANHYPGQCSNCHNTSNWSSVVFDHDGFTDCISCHSGDEPANHFDGQCSRCHTTSTWLGAMFNHTGLTDCISCHAGDAPAGHYSGQCSLCHEAGGSWANAQFNHNGLTDCISCHAGDAPSGHYPGQCSLCHDAGGSWANAQFNHSGFTDCISCHSGDRPADHDSGQCSDCHNTQSWDDGGDSGGDANNWLLISGNIFQNFSCQTCHPVFTDTYRMVVIQ